MKASDLLVAALEAEGVEYIFAVPGEENLDLLESLRTSSIRLIVTRHEQGAGFMAATYGRLTGKAGVCLATLGPGATNLTTPAAYAALGAFPLVMITGQKPIKVSKQAQFQIVDVVSLFTPLCKMAKQIVNGERIPSLVREGFRRAQEERPGAVLLELPEDIAEEETSAMNGTKQGKQPGPTGVARVRRSESSSTIHNFRFSIRKWARECLMRQAPCILERRLYHRMTMFIAPSIVPI